MGFKTQITYPEDGGRGEREVSKYRGLVIGALYFPKNNKYCRSF
jgi:hypothetical protein